MAQPPAFQTFPLISNIFYLGSDAHHSNKKINGVISSLPISPSLSQFCRDPETILSKVQEIGDLVTTIGLLAMETEVGVSILYVNMLV